MRSNLLPSLTLVDALATSLLNQGSLCNLGTTATEAEARKIEKYCKLIDNGHVFQPVASKVLLSSRVSVKCSVVRTTINELAAFLKQRTSMDGQIGNAAFVLRTVSDRDAFEEIYYKKLIFKSCISLQQNFLLVD